MFHYRENYYETINVTNRKGNRQTASHVAKKSSFLHLKQRQAMDNPSTERASPKVNMQELHSHKNREPLPVHTSDA